MEINKFLKNSILIFISLFISFQTLFAQQDAVNIKKYGAYLNGIYTLGYEVEIEQDIVVKELGVLDYNNNGVLDGDTPPKVGIWNSEGELLSSVEIPLETKLTNQGFYQAIDPINLSEGIYTIGVLTSYTSEYTGFGTSTYETAYPIKFIRGRYISSYTLKYPNLHYNAPAFFGPNFTFDLLNPSNVPMEVSTPKSPSIYQRNKDGIGNIPISGQVSSATKVEAKVTILKGTTGKNTEWKTIDDTIENGKFSGMLSVLNGWYKVDIRAFNGDTIISEKTIEKIGVGDNYLVAGQSNSSNWGEKAMSPDDERVLQLNRENIWQIANDPQPRADNYRGSPWPTFGSELVKELDIPIGIVSTGIGGTYVLQWKDYLYRQQLQPAIEDMKPYGFKAILWHQGEWDTHGTTQKQYVERLNAVIKMSRDDAGWSVPWGVAIATSYYGANPYGEIAIIAAQKQVIAEDENVFTGPNTNDMIGFDWRFDGVHFNVKGLIEHGKRWSKAVLTNDLYTSHTFNKLAIQSSTSKNDDASLAVDGNIKTTTASTNEGIDNWWQVDLGENKEIDKLVIWSITNDLKEYFVFVSKIDMKDNTIETLVRDTSIWKYYSAGEVTDELTLTPKTTARYIRIQKVGSGPLNITEVAAFAKDEE